MNTPKNNRHLRPTRNPTPRLSERKKKLFDVQELEEAADEDEAGDDNGDLLLDGIQPLRRTRSSIKYNETTPKSNNNTGRMLRSGSSSKSINYFVNTADTDDSTDQELLLKPTTSSKHRRSPRLSQYSSSSSSPEGNKENHNRRQVSTPAEEQLPHLFKESMRINAADKASISKMAGDRQHNNISQQHCPSTPIRTPKSRSRMPQIVIDETSTEDDDDDVDNKVDYTAKETFRTLGKRRLQMSPNVKSDDHQPQRKIRKSDLVIPTKAFYTKSNEETSTLKHSSSYSNPSKLSETRKLSPRNNSKKQWKVEKINKGVKHGIKRTMSATNHSHTKVDVDRILSQISNERLRNLITKQREDKAQIEEVHNILRSAKDPIKMARPLSVINNENDSNNNSNNVDIRSDNITDTGEHQQKIQPKSTQQQQHLDVDFSDIEQSDDDNDGMLKYDTACNESVIPYIRQDISISPTKSECSESTSPTCKRKFFKSGRKSTTQMEVNITGNIKASVCNGKISLIKQKPLKPMRLKVKTRVTNEFQAEQATVDAILKNLDDTAFGDIIESEASETTINDEVIKTSSAMEEEEQQQVILETPVDLQQQEKVVASVTNEINDVDIYAKFRNRIPYNTNDPMTIEQQHLLLDFLITNNICTEENFNIFIADPDNPDNRAAAARVVDNIVLIVNEEQLDFRKRLPYNTSDPLVIEQQEYFIDLLIKHNMCTEENFDIFIAHYEQRQDEAKALLATIYGEDQQMCDLVLKTNDTNTVVPNVGVMETTSSLQLKEQQQQQQMEVSSSQIHAMQVDDLVEVNEEIITDTESTVTLEEEAKGQEQPQSTQTPIIPKEKLFPVFMQGMKPFVKPKSTRWQPQQSSSSIGSSNRKVWTGGEGSNQYQLDFGQKEFGAKQCNQCGLVYTVHEAEEEQLHRDYHASMQFLRFNGWIDEDIVAVYSEWSSNGRILRLSDTSNTRRLERMKAILNIVDKELGYSNYKLPNTFFIYFAVINSKIVGICVVEPLEKARRYINVDGLDFCSEEEFEVKCGISRIWVSPLARRSGIASKLINSVQNNTIFGEKIPIEQIAFSSPTDVGKLFAQKITKTENFLVYQ